MLYFVNDYNLMLSPFLSCYCFIVLQNKTVTACRKGSTVSTFMKMSTPVVYVRPLSSRAVYWFVYVVLKLSVIPVFRKGPTDS